MPTGKSEERLSINPEMVTLARESRGFTQIDAARSLGISQARLSKIEAGLAPVPDDLVDLMVDCFHYPAEFFSLRDRLWGPGTSEFFHRKRQAASVRTLRQLHAEVNVIIISVSRLLRAVDVGIDAIPRVDPDEGWSAKEIAKRVRSQWQLPPGPIANVVEAIECAGGIVVSYDFGTPLVDALSRYVPGLPRMFFVDATIPGDRQRLTLAHELGHAIMHQFPHEDMEAQAYQFAAEFLMPEKEIKPQFDRVDIPKLASMKPYWKVSMGALLTRARDLGRVTPRMERYLWTQMSRAGYKTREPADLDIPREIPGLLTETIRLYQEELGYGLEELSRVMSLCPEDAQRRYGISPLRAETKARLRLA